jgi:hypothetical protein
MAYLKGLKFSLVFFGFFIGFVFCISQVSQGSQTPQGSPKKDGGGRNAGVSSPKTHFLVVGRARVSDKLEQQGIAYDSVLRVASAAKQRIPNLNLKLMVDKPITPGQFRLTKPPQVVGVSSFRQTLTDLAKEVSPEDTVIIYTHTHGFRDRADVANGGLVVGLPNIDENRGIFSWDEYCDLLLNIPAKNVVVLTMSCFSGGLVETLSSPKFKPRWEDRVTMEDRNFLVLTAQDGELPSRPIYKGGVVINPFTYCVLKILSDDKDEDVTFKKFKEFLVYWTKNIVSDSSTYQNSANPQQVGAYFDDDVIF